MGDLLASAGWDNTVRLWNSTNGVSIKTIGLPDRANSVSFSPDGSELAIACSDRSIKIWSIKNNQFSRLLTGHNSEVLTLAYSPDGNLLASGSGYPEYHLRLWDATKGTELRRFPAHSNDVLSVAFLR